MKKSKKITVRVVDMEDFQPEGDNYINKNNPSDIISHGQFENGFVRWRRRPDDLVQDLESRFVVASDFVRDAEHKTFVNKHDSNDIITDDQIEIGKVVFKKNENVPVINRGNYMRNDYRQIYMPINGDGKFIRYSDVLNGDVVLADKM